MLLLEQELIQRSKDRSRAPDKNHKPENEIYFIIQYKMDNQSVMAHHLVEYAFPTVQAYITAD